MRKFLSDYFLFSTLLRSDRNVPDYCGLRASKKQVVHLYVRCEIIVICTGFVLSYAAFVSYYVCELEYLKFETFLDKN